MPYHLVVTKEEPNPNYKPGAVLPYGSYEERERIERERTMKITRTLDVVLTDDEYATVKRAVVEWWK